LLIIKKDSCESHRSQCSPLTGLYSTPFCLRPIIHHFCHRERERMRDGDRQGSIRESFCFSPRLDRRGLKLPDFLSFIPVEKILFQYTVNVKGGTHPIFFIIRMYFDLPLIEKESAMSVLLTFQTPPMILLV
jgi:hypothetical protein